MFQFSLRAADHACAPAGRSNARRFVLGLGGVWLALLAGLMGCSPALDWRQVRPEDWQLGFQMPCRPEQHERQVPLAGGVVLMRMVSCTADGHLFALTSADVQDPQRVGQALQALAAHARANLRNEVHTSVPVQVPGMTPNADAQSLQISGVRPDGQSVQVRVLLFAHGARVFQASVLGPQSDGPRTGPLFESLAITP